MRFRSIEIRQRLLTEGDKRSPDVHRADAVQVETVHGRPTGFRDTDYLKPICTPLEVIGPGVAARIKERNHAAGNEINHRGRVLFPIVAVQAGEGKIV